MPRGENAYNQKLYEALKKREQGMSEKEKAENFMDLMILYRQIPDTEKNERNRQAIYQSLTDYMVPRGQDDALDKEQFESHLRELESCRMQHILRPTAEFVEKNRELYSDQWLYDRINTNSRPGMIQQHFTAIFSDILGNDREARKCIEKAYSALDALQFTQGRMEEAWHQQVENMSLAEQETVQDSNRFMINEQHIYDGKSKEYKIADQKKAQKEHMYSAREKDEHAMNQAYEYVSGIDLSFLDGQTERELRDGILEMNQKGMYDWVADEESDRSFQVLSEDIHRLSGELKEVTGNRLTDSAAFNAVRDRVEEVEKLIKKGNTPENRQAIAESLQTLETECQAYQDKNPGTRWSSRGNARKQVVASLQKMAKNHPESLTAKDKRRTAADGYAKQACREVQNMEDGVLFGDETRPYEEILVMGGMDPAQAHREVLDGVTRMRGGSGHPEKMAAVVNRCREVLGHLDVRAEALKELGVEDPSSLSKEEMRRILTAPENEERLNEFYVELAGKARCVSSAVQSEAFQALYQYMEASGTLDPSPENDRAVRSMLGLSIERDWQRMKEDYRDDSLVGDQVARAAALRTCVLVQREAILENGTLSGQDRLQSQIIRRLPMEMEKLLKEEPGYGSRDFRGVLDGLTMEEVMERDKWLPKAKQAAAAASARLQESILDAYNALLKPEFTENQDFVKLCKPYITNAGRADTFGAMLIGFMGQQGIDWNTALDDVNARQKAAVQLRKFMRKNELKRDKRGRLLEEQDPEKIEHAVKFYQGCYDVVNRQEIPDIDFRDPIQRAANVMKNNMLPLMMVNQNQEIDLLSKNCPPFKAAFDRNGEMEELRERQGCVQFMLNAPLIDKITPDSKMGYCAVELYGDTMRGQNMGQLSRAFQGIPSNTLGAPLIGFAQKDMGEEAWTIDECINGSRQYNMQEVKAEARDFLGVSPENAKKCDQILENLRTAKENPKKEPMRRRIDSKAFLAEGVKKAPERQSQPEKQVQKEKNQSGLERK